MGREGDVGGESNVRMKVTMLLTLNVGGGFGGMEGVRRAVFRRGSSDVLHVDAPGESIRQDIR